MKHLFLTILLLAFMPGFVFSQSITKGDLDSLNLPYSLPELVQVMSKRLSAINEPLLEKTFAVTKDYYGFQAAKKEIELLFIESANLKKIYQLNIELANRGEISDVQLLTSHNMYLSTKGSLVAKEAECRKYLLEIAQLCILNIEVNNEKRSEQQQKKKADPAAN